MTPEQKAQSLYEDYLELYKTSTWPIHLAKMATLKAIDLAMEYSDSTELEIMKSYIKAL